MIDRIAKYLPRQWYFGTSSWKYEGWKGLVYQRNYSSEKKFQDSCLQEYGDSYSCVGVDPTYYSWPSSKGFEKLISFTKIPKFAFKDSIRLRITYLVRLYFLRRLVNSMEHIVEIGRAHV